MQKQSVEAGTRITITSEIDAYLTGIHGDKYTQYRQNWEKTASKSSLPQKETLHPIHLIIELLDECNLRCSFCFRHVTSHINSGAVMSVKVFEKLIAEAVNSGVCSIALTTGEPLLHPEIEKILACVGKSGILDCFLYTNGLLMNPALLPLIFDSVTRLHVSIDAVNEEMYRNRRGGDWNRLQQNIDAFLALRRYKNTPMPFFWVSYVDDGKHPEVTEQFIEQWRDKADLIDIQQLIDRKLFMPELSPNPPIAKRQWCAAPFRQMRISANGDVTPCCGAYARYTNIGNYPQQSLADLWNNPKAIAMRESLLAGGEALALVCKNCLANLPC